LELYPHLGLDEQCYAAKVEIISDSAKEKGRKLRLKVQKALISAFVIRKMVSKIEGTKLFGHFSG